MAKFKAWGTKWEIEGGTPGTFTEIPQVMSIDSPQATTDEIEMTTLDNTTGYREFLPSFKDGGEMSFTLAADPALHIGGTDTVQALFDSGEVVNMRIHLPTTAPGFDMEFPGYVKSFAPGPLSPDDGITFVGSVRVAGAVTWVAST